jgi:hypothetical protein
MQLGVGLIPAGNSSVGAGKAGSRSGCRAQPISPCLEGDCPDLKTDLSSVDAAGTRAQAAAEEVNF